jgi:hypothetical protein
MAKEGNITLTIHGLVEFNDQVDGEVFAEKFSAFMKGLAIADETANGERMHKFVIAGLKKNTATAEVAEYEFRASPTRQSGFDYYHNAVEEIRRDSATARLLPPELVKTVVTLNKGARKRFEFGEIKFDRTADVIRLDPFLAAKAESVLADIRKQNAGALAFEGVAYGSFDGVLRAVDFQPTMKRGVLRLTAGGLPIICNITHTALDDVKDALEKRAIVYGLAHYDGQGLPRLLDIQKIDVLGAPGDLGRWRGAFDFPDNEIEEGWGEQ